MGRQRQVIDSAIAGNLHGVTINQPVELPAIRRTRIKAAEYGLNSSRHALAETRLEIRGTVKQAYYEVLRRKRELDLTRENAQLVEDLRRRIQVQVDAGEAGRIELIRAEAELAAARIQVKSTELRRVAALAALYAAVGSPLNASDVADRELTATRNLPPLETVREQALSAHPTLALAESEKQKAGAVLEYEKAQRVPQPTVWADVFRQPDVSQYRYGVTLDVPLWNQRKGQVAEARAAQRQADAAVDQRRVELSAALERAYEMYEVASQQVEMFETGTLKQAEAALTVAETAFRLGERSIVEVFDAQRVLRAARLDFLNAQFDRQQALIELEQMGALGVGGDRQ
jgi:cobalt-zinc-cadmium efflux system outer membrane protein